MDSAELREFIEETTDVGGQGTVLCRDARERRAKAAADYARFQNLVFALAAAAAAALIIGIILVVVGRPNEGIATGVAGLLSGGAALFILRQRNDARKQEVLAWGEVKIQCRPQVRDQEKAARLAVGLSSEGT